MEIVAPEKPHSDALGSFLAERVVKVDVMGIILTENLVYLVQKF